MWRATVLTIFPEMFPGPLGLSLAGKALATGLWTLEPIDIRAHAHDKHRSVDDTPAGGGPGMVMRADVLARAVDVAVGTDDARPRLAARRSRAAHPHTPAGLVGGPSGRRRQARKGPHAAGQQAPPGWVTKRRRCRRSSPIRTTERIRAL